MLVDGRLSGLYLLFIISFQLSYTLYLRANKCVSPNIYISAKNYFNGEKLPIIISHR